MPQPESTGRILVVDDEPSILDAVATALRYEGLAIREAATGRAALEILRTWTPDVVVLDIMLPDIDGIHVCRTLRAAGLDCHVLFLTARDHVANKLTGLDAGGDDYITKPFSLAEVVARTKAALRRRAMTTAPPAPPPAGTLVGPAAADGTAEPARLACGDVVLDLGGHRAWRAGVEIPLTATEFRLLAFFLENPQRVLSKQQILDAVWDAGFTGTPNVVEAYVGYLRRKLDPLGPPLIETIRLVGYVLRPVAGGGSRLPSPPEPAP